MTAYKAIFVLVTCNQDGFLLIVVHSYSPIHVYNVFQNIFESLKFEGQAIDIIILCDPRGESIIHQRPEKSLVKSLLTVMMNSLSKGGGLAESRRVWTEDLPLGIRPETLLLHCSAVSPLDPSYRNRNLQTSFHRTVPCSPVEPS